MKLVAVIVLMHLYLSRRMSPVTFVYRVLDGSTIYVCTSVMDQVVLCLGSRYMYRVLLYIC